MFIFPFSDYYADPLEMYINHAMQNRKEKLEQLD